MSPRACLHRDQPQVAPTTARVENAGHLMVGAVLCALVATQRPLFHDPSRKPVADVPVHREKTTLDQARQRSPPMAEAYLRSPVEMARQSLATRQKVETERSNCAKLLVLAAELTSSFPCEWPAAASVMRRPTPFSRGW